MTVDLPDPPERRTMPTLPPITVKRGRKFDEDLARIIDGKVLLPNFAKIPVDEFLDRLFWHGDEKSGRAVLDPDADPIRRRSELQAKYFLATSQWGTPTGMGIVIVRQQDRSVTPYEFAICRHEAEVEAGTDTRRGIYNAHCKHCGFDLSVDSSD